MRETDQADHRPRDVGRWHAHECNVVANKGAPAAIFSGDYHGEDVAVAQFDALRQARGARRVHLDHRVLGVAPRQLVTRGLHVTPRNEIQPFIVRAVDRDAMQGLPHIKCFWDRFKSWRNEQS